MYSFNCYKFSINVFFLRATACASLLRQRRPSVRLSVTLLYCVKTTQFRIMKSSPSCDSLEPLVSYQVILVPLGEEIPLELGHQIGVPPIEIVILPLLTHLAWKRLQIDTDLLRIITTTADELSGSTNIDDLERPWTPKIGGLDWFFSDFRLQYTFQEWIAPKPFKIDQDSLHTKCSALNVDFNGVRFDLSLIHIWRCRRSYACRSRWSPYH